MSRRRVLGVCGVLLLASCSARSSDPNVVTSEPARIVGQLTRAFAVHPGTTQAFHSALPATADDALRLSIDDGTWIELRPRGARAVARRDEQGTAVYAGALDDVDLVYVTEQARVEELRLAHTLGAAAQSTWNVRLGPKMAGLRIKDGRVEAYDASGAVRLVTEPAWAADAHGRRRALSLRIEGSTLTATLDVEGLAPPIAIDPAWTAAANMSTTRAFPIVAKLSTGKVLVAGGASNTTGDISTAELYDPATNTFSSAPTMAYPHTAMSPSFAVIDGGRRVLISETRSDSGPVLDGEIYDAPSNTFKKTTLPLMTRGHTATLLADGKVALIGGRDESGNFPTSVRIFNPATDSWTSYSPSTTYSGGTRPLDGRIEHCAVLLADGRVLVIGGKLVSGAPGSTTLRLTEDTLTWDPTTPTSYAFKARLPTGRSDHACYVLTRGVTAGKVLAFGGFIKNLDDTGTIPSTGGMLYDPAADSWVLAPLLSVPRTYFASSMLADGRILVTGGTAGIGASFTADQTAELFDGSTWIPAGTMVARRGAHGSVPLGPKEIFIVGGAKEAIEGLPTFLASTERFKLQELGASCNAPGECDSGFCVDGVCCASACTDQCAACDVPGNVGTCKPVKGTPHGKRTVCDPAAKAGDVCALSCDGADTTACKYPTTAVSCGAASCVAGVETHVSTCDGAGACKDVPKSCGDFVCAADACKTSCATKADCVNPNHFCSYGKCIPVGANGATCTGDEACASGSCVDGVCCESKCTGQCEACDVPGQVGKCVAVKGKPHGTRPMCTIDSGDACNTQVCDGTNTASCAAKVGPCGSYACDATSLSCKTTCSASADCAKGYECSDGACVPKTSKCTPDLTGLVGTDGKTTSCSPLLCRDGQCLPNCKSSADCQGGYLCDGSGQCVPPTPATTDDGGGCAVHGAGSARSGVLVFAALALLALRRRRS